MTTITLEVPALLGKKFLGKSVVKYKEFLSQVGLYTTESALDDDFDIDFKELKVDEITSDLLIKRDNVLKKPISDLYQLSKNNA